MHKLGVINIKLQSNDRSGIAAYKELFQVLYDRRKRIVVKLSKNDSIRLRTAFFDNENYIAGFAVRFTNISDKGWLDDESDDILDGINVPEGKHPNSGVFRNDYGKPIIEYGH